MNYYEIGNHRILTNDAISELALEHCLQSTDIKTIKFKNAIGVIVEAISLRQEAFSTPNNGEIRAIGASVEIDTPYSLPTATSKAQRAAFQQLIPQSEIKAVLGEPTDGYEPPQPFDHFGRAYALMCTIKQKHRFNEEILFKQVKVAHWGHVQKDKRKAALLSALLFTANQFPNKFGFIG